MEEMPSPEQVQDFVDHVCRAHSWYRHLSLATGGEFAFFLADGAGAGYSIEHPRLHYTWKTTDEYRARFGRLDYQWRSEPDEPYRRDGISPPVTGVPMQTVTLYPYVSIDFNAPEAIGYAHHQADLPYVDRDDRDLILAWDAALRSDDDSECDRVYWQLQEREQRKIEEAVEKVLNGAS